jgi:hypothetical protein
MAVITMDAADAATLSGARVAAIIAAHERTTLPRLSTYWRYYRNATTGVPTAGPRAAALAQAAGLPRRLMGDRRSGIAPAWDGLREIVIENDIAWRIHTMVEFMFGRPVRLASAAPDPQRAAIIGRVVESVWEASGGIGLLQDLALLAHVYGHADLVLRIDDAAAALGASADPADAPARAAEALRIEIVEPTRGVPVMDAADPRRLAAYVIHTPAAAPAEVERTSLVQGRSRWLRALAGALGAPARPQTPATAEVLTAAGRRIFTVRPDEETARLVDETPAPVDLGRVPVVHIQNLSQPFCYEGLGEVEPLIPLQDELNTRLSDRASRVTMQSFKMYLAKGLDGFENAPVGPGRVWSTDNPEASIESFGGDAASPSEDRHIEEIREALDKASGVPPLATGVVRARVGNLTSENALRLTLTGLLSRTMRKRITYGRGLVEMSSLVLAALDALGIFRTAPGERTVRVEWPDPLPRDEREQVLVAQMKRDLGVPAERLLAELGYASADPGVV